MKKAVGTIFGWNRRNFVLLGLVLSLVAFGLVAFKADAQSKASGENPSLSRADGSTNTEVAQEPVYESSLPEGGCSSVITQSTSQAITAGSVSCNNAGVHTDNRYYRAFNMTSYGVGVGQDYNITSVSFGVELANGAGAATTQPVTVTLYANNGTFPTGFPGTGSVIGTANVVVSDQTNTVLNVPIIATVPAGTTQLVMEVFTPASGPGNSFFIGSNAAAENGPSYLQAAACTLPNPTTTTAAGFPNMHIVMNVNGSCSAPSGCTPIPQVAEVEANGTSGTAQVLTLTNSSAIVNGAVTPTTDVDFYRVNGVPAGAKAWFYTDSGGALVAGDRDTFIEVIAADGTTIIESDDDDGTGNGGDGTIETTLASSVAGRTLTAGGTYYFRVRGFGTFPGSSVVNPYKMFLTITNAAPVAEIEPNDTAATATVLIGAGQQTAVASGVRSTSTDTDFFSVQAKAGRNLFVSMDGDPNRSGTNTFDGIISLIAPDGTTVLVTIDSSAGGSNVPNTSEGFDFLIPSTGTYYVRVAGFGAEAGRPYNLMVTNGDNCGTTCSSTPVTFNYTGAVQSYTVPAGVTSIEVEASGAQGGGSFGGTAGGLGARTKGTFAVTPGQVLSVVVGQQGLLQVGGNAQNSSGGGGGSFVFGTGPSLLMAAGGGGGKCNYNSSGPLHAQAAGQITTSGGASQDGNPGGTAGNGGPTGLWSGVPDAGGGTGWSSNGGGPYGGIGFNTWTGGPGYCDGGGGGCGGVGGFGGGGGGGNHFGGGGGGGGYSGGAGGTDPTHGGGGGSFNGGTGQTNTPGIQTGNGVVVITPGCAAPPATDLAITKTDGITNFTAPGQTTYTIVVTNNGPNPAVNALVTDNFPAGVTVDNWTCLPQNQAHCTLAGAGNINQLVYIPVGGILTYTATATVAANQVGQLINTATVTPPATMTDTNQANNSATDTDNFVVSISGNVKQYVPAGNTNLAGVTMTASCSMVVAPAPEGSLLTTTTNASGNFTFANIPSGSSCTITPSMSGKVFDPVSRTVTAATANVTGVNFIAYDTASIPRNIHVLNTHATPGNAVTVPIRMASQGTEKVMAASIDYPIGVLHTPVVGCGVSTPGCTVVSNTATLGKVGFTITAAGAGVAAGLREIATVTFQTNVGFAPPNAALDFSTTPTAQSVRDVANNELQKTFTNGFVVFIDGMESDVAGRNTGNGDVLSTDVTQVRRFVVGTDTINLSFNEFQRADAAPLATFGDGVLGPGDVIQAKRYSSRLDALVAAAGPAGPPPPPLGLVAPAPIEEVGDTSRVIRTETVKADPGQSVTVGVDLESMGDEIAASFTLEYDATRLTNARVTLADDAAAGAVLTVNTDDIASGRIGILVDASQALTRDSAARRLVNVTFDVAANAAGGEARIRFTDGLAMRGVSNDLGNTLDARYADGAVTISGPEAAGFDLTGRVTTPDGRGLKGAQVTVIDNDGQARTVTTSAFGYYRFEGLAPSETYTVGITTSRLRFAPRTITRDNLTDVDFVANE